MKIALARGEEYEREDILFCYILSARQLKSLGRLLQCPICRCVTKAMNDSEKMLNSVSEIDRVSRIVFSSTYIVINIIYWYLYLDRSERITLNTEE